MLTKSKSSHPPKLLSKQPDHRQTKVAVATETVERAPLQRKTKRVDKPKPTPTPMTARAKVSRGDDLADLTANLSAVERRAGPETATERNKENRFAGLAAPAEEAVPQQEQDEQAEENERARSAELAARGKYSAVYNAFVDLKYELPKSIRAELTAPGYDFLAGVLEKIEAQSFDEENPGSFEAKLDTEIQKCKAWMDTLKARHSQWVALSAPLVECDEIADQLREMVQATPSFKNSKAVTKQLDGLLASFDKKANECAAFWNDLLVIDRKRKLVAPPNLRELKTLKVELMKIGATIEEAIEATPSQSRRAGQRADASKKVRVEYPYGAADSVPHIHAYPGGGHLKILDRGRIRRYNIVQNGSRHVQADSALAAAAGNPVLVGAINSVLASV